MDVVGRIHLADGTELSAVAGLDDHSRFCVCARLVARATARPVCDALLAAMAALGTPEGILTDNGKVFTAQFGRARCCSTRSVQRTGSGTSDGAVFADDHRQGRAVPQDAAR